MAGAKAVRENGIKQLSTFPALVQVQNPTVYIYWKRRIDL